MFAAVIAALSAGAYALIAGNYRSIVAPALDTPEGRAGFAAAMRPALLAILSFDGALLLVVGAASYVLARVALRPLALAREREERFAADVAHELRTPLAAIAAVAQSGAAAEPDAARGAFETIARRALEGSDLIGDLLTLARRSDDYALDREPVDFAAIVRRVVAEAATDAPHVRLDEPCASAIVDGDERRLLQLVRNLVWNARAYAATRVDVRLACAQREAVLTIDDDGPGVAPELAGRLFERFAKGPASRGSGLGLAIARWVAAAHGGDLTFEGGSRFVARIPLADPSG